MSRRRPHSIPQGAHPLVQMLFVEMNRRGLTVLQMSGLTGIYRNTINSWRYNRMPRADLIAECYAAMGMTLLPVPREHAGD